MSTETETDLIAAKRREFLAAQQRFYSASVTLLHAWQDLDNEAHAMTGAEEYPFTESFDEIVCRIGNWLEVEV